MNTTSHQEAKNIFNIEQFNGGNINVNSAQFGPVEALSYEDLAAPEVAEDLVDELKKHTVILISGDLTFDKNSLLRSIAYKLFKEKKDLAIQEWFGGMDNTSFFQSIRSLNEKSILVVDELMPKDIQFDVQRLVNEVRSAGHFLIASTKGSPKTWHLDSKFTSLFNEIGEGDISYDEKTIKQVLQRKLDLNRHLYTFEVTNANFNAGNILSGTTKVKDLALEFSSPEQVDTLIRLLAKEDETITKDKLSFLTRRAVEEDRFSFSSWFGPLSEREKLSALALALFDGFSDSQFFSAMQLLAEDSWGERSNDLKALDYTDILPLLNVFKLEPSVSADGPQNIIVGRYPGQQEQLFQTIWFSHRRHLVKALPVLVQLAKGSIDDRFSNRELYGSRSKRRRVRQAIAQTLSKIGKKSLETVEPVLLELASHNNQAIQSVAALAMAQWYAENEHGTIDLLHLLEEWRTDARILDYVHSYLDKGEAQIQSAITYIKATIVLTLGYAAQYDPPGSNNQDLLMLLFSFLKDKNKQVRNRLKHALPYVVRSQNLDSFSDKLDRLLPHTDLLESIASGVVWAWQDDPDSTEKYLIKELDKVLTTGELSLKQQLKRDDKTAFLSICLGLLMNQEGADVKVGGIEASNRLWKLRELTPNPFVKELVWNIHLRLGALPHGRYGELETRIGTISKDGEEEILDALGKQYLSERRELTGGDETLERGRETYAVWISNDRPETNVESLMYRWLLGETTGKQQLDEKSERMLQQTAFMAFQRFARVFDHWESQRIKEKLEKQKVDEQKAKIAAQLYEYQHVESAIVPLNQGIFGKVWNNLFGTEKSRLILALNNIIRNSPNVDKNLMLLVVEKWKGKNSEFEKVAHQIEKTIKKTE